MYKRQRRETMTLSKQVEESLRDAQGNLRNALAFAARTESPYVNKHIADLLSNIEAVIDVQKIVEKVENNDVPF